MFFQERKKIGRKKIFITNNALISVNYGRTGAIKCDKIYYATIIWHRVLFHGQMDRALKEHRLMYMWSAQYRAQTDLCEIILHKKLI